MDPRIIKHVERQHIGSKIAAMTGAGHGLRPTLDQPLATGINRDAVRATVEREIAAMDCDLEAIEDGGRALAGALGFCAALSGQDAASLLDRVAAE
ncbi:hypothetical protein [Mesorhizobium sp. ANAO-SY3R2]|uniref:hypothetical protein n=1 Tax=Mesorhizobium sp. ANAO-SY3R2 TaxID=3166644 RepID=UPI003670CB3B